MQKTVQIHVVFKVAHVAVNYEEFWSLESVWHNQNIGLLSVRIFPQSAESGVLYIHPSHICINPNTPQHSHICINLQPPQHSHICINLQPPQHSHICINLNTPQHSQICINQQPFQHSHICITLHPPPSQPHMYKSTSTPITATSV